MDIVDWVADGYGYPRWVVRLLLDLAILEARAARNLAELAKMDPRQRQILRLCGSRTDYEIN